MARLKHVCEMGEGRDEGRERGMRGGREGSCMYIMTTYDNHLSLGSRREA